MGKNREGGKSGAWKAAQGCFREEKPLSWMKVVAVDMREVSVSLGLNSFSVSQYLAWACIQWIPEGVQGTHGIQEPGCTVQILTQLLISSVTRSKLFNLLVP